MTATTPTPRVDGDPPATAFPLPPRRSLQAPPSSRSPTSFCFALLTDGSDVCHRAPPSRLPSAVAALREAWPLSLCLGGWRRAGGVWGNPVHVGLFSRPTGWGRRGRCLDYEQVLPALASLLIPVPRSQSRPLAVLFANDHHYASCGWTLPRLQREGLLVTRRRQGRPVGRGHCRKRWVVTSAPPPPPDDSRGWRRRRRWCGGQSPVEGVWNTRLACYKDTRHELSARRALLRLPLSFQRLCKRIVRAKCPQDANACNRASRRRLPLPCSSLQFAAVFHSRFLASPLPTSLRPLPLLPASCYERMRTTRGPYEGRGAAAAPGTC